MPGMANFTGAFVGMACQDMSGAGRHADFDWFEYRERDYAVDPEAALGKPPRQPISIVMLNLIQHP